MNTSDEKNAREYAGRFTSLDESGVAPAGSLPDVSMLERMANEFFRAQPGAPAVAVPAASGMTPEFETRLPQFGTSMPSMPSVPSALSGYQMPNDDVPGVASLEPNFDTHLPQSGMPLPAMPALPSAGGVPMVPELAPFMPGSAASSILPAAAPQVGQDFLQHDMRTAGAGAALSPFAMPMPLFDAAFPSFETGVPAIPALPPLRGETDARSALTDSSPYYFLEHAGALNRESMAPSSVYPQSVATVAQPAGSPFSMPMPEFDEALFPSFVHGVPELPPLPPLLNEADARSALTNPSSLYFLRVAVWRVFTVKPQPHRV